MNDLNINTEQIDTAQVNEPHDAPDDSNMYFELANEDNSIEFLECEDPLNIYLADDFKTNNA